MKIRNIVDTDNIHVCWNDVILQAIEVSKPCIDLEYNSKKADLKRAKEALRDLESKIKVFKDRLHNEITDDVLICAAEKNKNYKGNAESLIKFRANQ